MLLFWILASLMLVVALAFVLVPLLRSRTSGGPTAVEANLEVLRGQRREIEEDVAAGLLPGASRDEALAELVARADEDLAARGETAPAQPRRPWAIAAIAGVAVPAIVLGVYLAIGSPRALDVQAVAAAPAPGGANEQQIVEMVESLAQKVRERPQDAQGWALLARSMAALGRFQESSDAYAHLAGLTPDDPQVFADWADSLGMAQGRTLAGKPYELAKKALSLDPNHPKALALAGTAALDAGDFAQALRHWQALAAALPPDSPDRQQVASIIGEVRGRAAQAGKPLPGGPDSRAVTNTPAAKAPEAKAPETKAPPPAAPGGVTITGSVALAPALAPLVKGGETLFVYARAEGGPRMPLAIIRTGVRDLPMKFSLDDSMAMAPTMKLSGAAAVRIEARVSATGNAMAQPGDLVGTSAVVKPGARDVAIVIDRVAP
jgi:cytochrome c-type biogenesis protein CcmH